MSPLQTAIALVATGAAIPLFCWLFNSIVRAHRIKLWEQEQARLIRNFGAQGIWPASRKDYEDSRRGAGPR